MILHLFSAGPASQCLAPVLSAVSLSLATLHLSGYRSVIKVSVVVRLMTLYLLSLSPVLPPRYIRLYLSRKETGPALSLLSLSAYASPYSLLTPTLCLSVYVLRSACLCLYWLLLL